MSSYATPDDFASLGIVPAALDGIADAEKQAALNSASSLADGYLGAKFRLPILTPSADLKGVVCRLANYDLLAVRGFNPELGADVVIRDRYQDAVRWLEGVAAGKITPPLIDSTPGGVAALGGPFVQQPVVSYDGTTSASRPAPRGW